MDRQACGCPVSVPTYALKCAVHAALDGRAVLPWRTSNMGSWYDENCCRFCGRVSPYGLACAWSEHCGMCGVRSCASHGQATYKLHVQCPHETNPRTKYGRTLLRSLTMFGQALQPRKA